MMRRLWVLGLLLLTGCSLLPTREASVSISRDDAWRLNGQVRVAVARLDVALSANCRRATPLPACAEWARLLAELTAAGTAFDAAMAAKTDSSVDFGSVLKRLLEVLGQAAPLLLAL